MGGARIYRSPTTKWITRCNALRSWLTTSAEPFPGGNTGLYNHKGRFTRGTKRNHLLLTNGHSDRFAFTFPGFKTRHPAGP